MERRASPRVPLDIPFFITLVLPDATSASAMLVDVSVGGAQAALALHFDNTDSLLGQEIIVKDLPAELDPEKKGCSGLVTWVTAQRCGVRFFIPLNVGEETLKEVVYHL